MGVVGAVGCLGTFTVGVFVSSGGFDALGTGLDTGVEEFIIAEVVAVFVLVLLDIPGRELAAVAVGIGGVVASSTSLGSILFSGLVGVVFDWSNWVAMALFG